MKLSGMGNTRFTVMRSPCLQEDEGRHFYVRSYATYCEAADWIDAQKDEYFKPGDYYITERLK